MKDDQLGKGSLRFRVKSFADCLVGGSISWGIRLKRINNRGGLAWFPRYNPVPYIKLLVN